jgi:hypothetical protein
MGRRTPAQREKRNERERQRYADDPAYRRKCLAGSNAYKALHRDERNAKLRDRYANDDEFRATAQASNRKSRLKVSLQRDHGMSLQDYAKMLAGQHGKCRICHAAFSRTPCRDHDHDSGELRGLLCRRCNLGLGHFDDNPLWLRRAADYLERRLSGSDDGRELIRAAIQRELGRRPGAGGPAPANKLQQIVRAIIDRAGERGITAIQDLLKSFDKSR